jgi:hypothetical protein
LTDIPEEYSKDGYKKLLDQMIEEYKARNAEAKTKVNSQLLILDQLQRFQEKAKYIEITLSELFLHKKVEAVDTLLSQQRE